MINITKIVDISPLNIPKSDLGECPIWDDQEQHFWMMDCRKGLIFDFNPQTKFLKTYQVPAPAGSFAFNTNNQLIVALKDEVVMFDPERSSLKTMGRLSFSHPNLRFNDGTALPDNSFLVGTMHVHREEGVPPLGGIYHLSKKGSLTLLRNGIAVANGPSISPINQRLYICDSARMIIYSYSIENGILSDEQIFTDTSSLNSAPDGCCFDSSGGLWCALVHAGKIVRFDDLGRLSHVIDLPIAHPTSLCFGGPNLDELYVTSIKNSGRLQANGPFDGAALRVKGSGFWGITQPICDIY